MIKFENIILRRSNQSLCLQLGFNKIKEVANLNNPIGETQLANKQMYLKYVEEVLTNKQSELIKWEKELNQRDKNLSEDELQKNLGFLVHMGEEIKLVQKKIHKIHQKYGQIFVKQCKNKEDINQYTDLMTKLEYQSAKFKQEIQEILKKQFTNVLEERKNLRNQISQYSQLYAYEKYLNELHDAIEKRSQQLIRREEELSNYQQQSRFNIQPAEINKSYHNQTFSDNQSQLTENQSGKKRAKIFDTKLAVNRHQLSWGTQKDTFASNPNKKTCNESSQIMNEDSLMNKSKDKNQYIQHRRQKPQIMQIQQYESSASKNILVNNHPKIFTKKPTQTITTSKGIQVNEENADETGQRLRKQALILKYAKKWMKICVEGDKTHQRAKRNMAVHLWRMNTCYDETIPKKAVQQINQLQNLYQKSFKNLRAMKLFPYNQLSLKRKKYVEKMFDFERKRYRRTQIQRSLKSILTNKHRKQRLTFFYYFLKFYRNSAQFIPSQHTQQTFRKPSTNPLKKQGFSHKSSFVFHEEKPNKPIANKNNLSSIAASSQKTLNRSQNQSNSELGKENMSSKYYSSNKFDEKKLKQFIIEKQRTQKLLATQCVKLEGIAKMSVIFALASSRQIGTCFRKIMDDQTEEKFEELKSHIAGLDFKIDLVLTKCRLGLANNSNKISSLEHLLGISNGYK